MRLSLKRHVISLWIYVPISEKYQNCGYQISGFYIRTLEDSVNFKFQVLIPTVKEENKSGLVERSLGSIVTV